MFLEIDIIIIIIVPYINMYGQHLLSEFIYIYMYYF